MPECNKCDTSVPTCMEDLVLNNLTIVHKNQWDLDEEEKYHHCGKTCCGARGKPRHHYTSVVNHVGYLLCWGYAEIPRPRRTHECGRRPRPTKPCGSTSTGAREAAQDQTPEKQRENQWRVTLVRMTKFETII